MAGMAAMIQLQQQFHDQHRSQPQSQPQPMDTSSTSADSADASEIGTPSSSSVTSVSSHSNPSSPKSSTAGQQVYQHQQETHQSRSHADHPRFTCGFCNKSFEKKSSRNRHANNCKTKPAGERLTKQKSCVHCVKTKTRCDTLLPRCTRCRMKGLECKYVHKTTNSATIVGKAQHPQRSSSASESAAPVVNNTTTTTTTTTTTNANQQQHATPGTFPDGNDINIFGTGNNPFPQGVMSPGLGGENFNFDWQLNSPVHTAPLLLPDLFGFPDIADQHDHSGRFIESASSSSRTSSISTPSSDINMLAPNTPQEASANACNPIHQANAQQKKAQAYEYVRKIIRAYPTMMLRTSNLPPFVNHYMYTSGKCGTALSNCTSIMQMNKIKTRETRELVWRVIEMECSRIMKEYTRYNDLELLGATQAIVLYVVLWCIEEDPNIRNKFKVILYNMHEICQRLCASGRYMCKAEVEGRRPVWEEWLFFESIRRTASLLYILDLLYDISSYLSKSKCDGLFELPLPATKNLWNASKRSEWEEEYDWILSERRGKGMLKYDSLLMTSSVYGNANLSEDPDLNLWYANVDEYGMLVSLIIS